MPRIVFSPQILPKTVVDLARSMAPADFDLTITDPGTPAFTQAIRDAEYFLGFVRGGMVALKKSVCLGVGTWRRMRLMSGRKPMSNMRSASSSTRYSSPASAA